MSAGRGMEQPALAPGTMVPLWLGNPGSTMHTRDRIVCWSRTKRMRDVLIARIIAHRDGPCRSGRPGDRWLYAASIAP